MWRSLVRTTGLAIALAAALAACGDDSTPDEPGPGPGPGPGSAAAAPCFDQGEVAKPPDGQLPCELLSPEFRR